MDEGNSPPSSPRLMSPRLHSTSNVLPVGHAVENFEQENNFHNLYVPRIGSGVPSSPIGNYSTFGSLDDILAQLAASTARLSMQAEAANRVGFGCISAVF